MSRRISNNSESDNAEILTDEDVETQGSQNGVSLSDQGLSKEDDEEETDEEEEADDEEEDEAQEEKMNDTPSPDSFEKGISDKLSSTRFSSAKAKPVDPHNEKLQMANTVLTRAKKMAGTGLSIKDLRTLFDM